MSANDRSASEGRRRHLAPIDGDGEDRGLVRLAQGGDRVEVIGGPHAGRTGHVVGVALVRCLRIRRYPVVILDGQGVRLPRHFDDADLRIID